MRTYLRFLIFLIPALCFCQELPPVINYESVNYNAGNQNWMLSQAPDRHVYSANGLGLLEYTGAEWTLYPMPNQTVVRSVKVAKDRVFTGAYMEFGFWKENKKGKLKFTSLLPKLPKPVQDGEQFWHIVVLENVVVFQSFNNIYKYNLDTGLVSGVVTGTTHPITNLFKIEQQIYFYIAREGLYTIKNGKPTLVVKETILPLTNIVHVFRKDGNLHFIGQNGQFYYWNGTKIIYYNRPLSNQLSGKSVFSALNLPRGGLILGTVEDGIYFVDLQGKIKYHFNQENGLINNTVLSLFFDNDGNIWAGLDNGIAVINLDSPYRIFQDNQGKIGSVYASFRLGNMLYLGTNQGLYYKKDDQTYFTLVKGTNGQVWTLKYLDGVLFCGHNTGTYVVEGTTAIRISDHPGTWTIKKLKNRPNLYIQGHYNGISLLRNQGDSIKSLPFLKGFPYSSKFIISETNGDIWIGNEHKGVFKVRLENNLSEISIEENYKFPKLSGITSSIFKFNDNLYYATKKQILRYQPKTDSFTENNKLNKHLDTITRTTGKFIRESETKIWGFAQNLAFSVGLNNLTSSYTLKPVYLTEKMRNITRGFENIENIAPEKYLLGIAGGYLTFYKSNSITRTPEISLDKIEIAALDESFEAIKRVPDQEFHNKTNNISFKFSIAEFKKFLIPSYSYRLQGLSEKWSPWSRIPSATFKNLGYGDYQFQVKGKIGNKSSQVRSFSFTIKRPWYLSYWAFAAYILVLLLVLVVVHNTYKRRHKRQLRENEKALRMKNLETQETITRLQKEQLEKEVTGKNKELAISTMSLIQKNEFLSNIKKKLENSPKSAQTSWAIKTIEKEISEKDNWNSFKEAFRNADKDFFKKIKKQHPQLTSNDLRLCAYLRLNLSSKEIAPLLNISTKSVEIKRYRLRKKLNLTRNTNLTDYVLQI